MTQLASAPSTSEHGVEPAQQDSPAGRLLRSPWLLAAVAFVAYSTWSISRYERFADRSWDLSIFTQAIGHYAHLQAPTADIKGNGFNLLGDHFSPAIAILAPIYRIFPTPVTLEICQAFLLALAGIPITRTAQKQLGHWPGTAIGLAYLLAWGTQSAIDSDFHEVCIAVPLLAFALEAVLGERWRAAAIWCVPIVLVKEDLGLTVAALGAYFLLRRHRTSGIRLIGFGIGSFLLTTYVLIPAANPHHRYDYWGTVNDGHTPALESWGGMLAHLPAHLFGNDQKVTTLVLVIGVTGFMCLRSPLFLLALPTLFWRFLSTNPSYWGHAWHYDVILMPIVFAALIDATRRSKNSGRAWLRTYVKHVPAVTLTFALLVATQFPLDGLIHTGAYKPADRAAVARAAIAAIPKGVSVETDIGLMTHLVAGRTIYWIGNTGGIDPDYLVIDGKAGWSPAPPTDPARYAEQLHPGSHYRMIFNQDGYEIAQRT